MWIVLLEKGCDFTYEASASIKCEHARALCHTVHTVRNLDRLIPCKGSRARLRASMQEVSLKDSSGQWLYLQQKPAWFTKLNPLGKVRTSNCTRCPSCHHLCNQFCDYCCGVQVPVIAWEEDGTLLSVYERYALWTPACRLSSAG